MHTIRLRGPWQRILLGDAHPLQTTVPETGAGHSVGASYKRNFNCPTGIENAQVFLALESWRGQLDGIALNQHPLPSGPAPLLIDITDKLQPQNTLVIHLRENEQPVKLDGEVSLKIAENIEHFR